MTFPPETVERVKKALISELIQQRGECQIDSDDNDDETGIIGIDPVIYVESLATAALAAAWAMDEIPKEVDKAKAPFDGKAYIILCLSGMRIAQYLTSLEEGDSAFIYARGHLDDGTAVSFSCLEPTHYLPLPSPPADVKGEVG